MTEGSQKITTIVIIVNYSMFSISKMSRTQSFLLTTYHKVENEITSKNNIMVNVINHYSE